MTHRDAGRYAAKHGPEGIPDARIAAAVRGKVAAGELACSEAEKIGSALGVSLEEVGRSLDLLEIRIGRCQLGLFGYGKERKAVRPAERADRELEAAIRGGLVGERLPCATAWKIAAERNLSRMEVAGACEGLGIRIKPCQLGAF
jgi:hypothetical protein